MVSISTGIEQGPTIQLRAPVYGRRGEGSKVNGIKFSRLQATNFAMNHKGHLAQW